MRKFHNSMAVGFFMGGVVAMAQLFFMLFLMWVIVIVVALFLRMNSCFLHVFPFYIESVYFQT